MVIMGPMLMFEWVLVLRSTDFSKPSGQVAARWPLPSEVFAPFASIPERTPLATMHKISQQAEVKPTN